LCLCAAAPSGAGATPKIRPKPRPVRNKLLLLSRCSTILKFAILNGLVSPYSAICSGASAGVNSTIRLFFTANTASDSMYGLPATKMCVVSGRCPGAVTMKWICAGR
jgi:hypothetical protein